MKTTMAAVALTMLSLAAATASDLDHAVFVTTPKWYQLSRNIREDDILIFRRYAISVIDDKMRIGPGDVKDIYDFGCQRTAGHPDYVVFHFPEWIELAGIKRDDWIPKMRLQIALDRGRNTFEAEGEFKNGSLFVDLNELYRDSLLRLIDAEETIVQLPSGERLTVLQRRKTPDGKGDVAGFVDRMVDVISEAVHGGDVARMDTADMLRRCLAYKKTGRH